MSHGGQEGAGTVKMLKPSRFAHYIPPRNLKNLHDYRYCGEDRSLVSRYVQRHIWNGFLKLTPMWISPNLITLIGLLFACASHGLVWYYCPTLEGPIPGWVLVLCAVFLYLYQALDAIDGKQARRTGTSGPLGELFDHGCDCLNTFVSGITAAAALQLGSTPQALAVLLVGFCIFFISSWETYHTGCMYFGYVNFPQEGLLTVMGTYLLTAYKGVGMWVEVPFDKHGWPFVPGWRVTDYVLLFGFVTVLALAVICYRNVAAHYRKKFPHKLVARARIREALLTLTPFVMWLVLGLSWIALSTPQLIQESWRLVCLSLGFIFCRILNQLILCNLVKMRYPLLELSLAAPWLFGIVNSSARLAGFRLLTDRLCVQLIFAYCFVLYSHFVIVVIHQITQELDIWCLRIKPKSSGHPGEGKQA